MFVKSNRFRRNSKIHIYDKGVPTVHSTERAVIPFLKWFDTPKGTPAYKFFKMSNKKNSVNVVAYAKYLQFKKEGDSLKENQFKTSDDYHSAWLKNLNQQYIYLRTAYSHLFSEPINPVLL